MIIRWRLVHQNKIKQEETTKLQTVLYSAMVNFFVVFR